MKVRLSGETLSLCSLLCSAALIVDVDMDTVCWDRYCQGFGMSCLQLLCHGIFVFYVLTKLATFFDRECFSPVSF